MFFMGKCVLFAAKVPSFKQYDGFNLDDATADDLSNSTKRERTKLNQDRTSPKKQKLETPTKALFKPVGKRKK